MSTYQSNSYTTLTNFLVFICDKLDILLSFKKLLDIINKKQLPKNQMNQPYAHLNAPYAMLTRV